MVTVSGKLAKASLQDLLTLQSVWVENRLGPSLGKHPLVLTGARRINYAECSSIHKHLANTYDVPGSMLASESRGGLRRWRRLQPSLEGQRNI